MSYVFASLEVCNCCSSERAFSFTVIPVDGSFKGNYFCGEYWAAELLVR